MKYCSQCEAEYQDWVRECSDCHVPLVSELPKKEPEKIEGEAESIQRRPEANAELICVKVFLNEQEAEIARGLLESNGILPMLVLDSDPSREGMRFSKGNQIWVRKEDVEAAAELLNNPKA